MRADLVELLRQRQVGKCIRGKWRSGWSSGLIWWRGDRASICIACDSRSGHDVVTELSTSARVACRLSFEHSQ
jgi:hypothetical protein